MTTVTSPRRLARRRDLLYAVLPVTGLLLWYFATAPENPNIPSPVGVLQAAEELIVDGRLFGGLATSMLRVLSGFGIALLVGTLVGIWIGRNRIARGLLDPLIEMTRPIAPIALVPLAILWLGTGNSPAIAIIAYAAFFPVVASVYSSVQRLDRSLLDAARTFGVTSSVVLRHVILPGILPGLIVGARLGMGLAWTAVVAAELAVVESDASVTPGIGQLMLIFYQYQANPNPIVVCMIAIGALGIVLDTIIRKIGAWTTPWLR